MLHSRIVKMSEVDLYRVSLGFSSYIIMII